MSRHDNDKRIFMVEKYHELGSSLKVIEAWKREFPNKKPPKAETVLRQVKKFHEHGSIKELPRPHTKINQKREAAKAKLIDLIHANPSLSIRHAACAVEMSYGSTQSFLKEDLHLKPYKVHEYHELKPPDYAKRVEFAEWMLSLPIEALSMFSVSDEAYFYLTLPVNSQNNRYWSLDKPIGLVEKPLQDEKVLVWCAMTSTKIYGPYFFDEAVNQHNYLHMLKHYFWPKHTKVENYHHYYFQQDGASSHTSTIVQAWLKSKFGDFFIDKTKWPPRSPDLNPCDFFLWGYLKAKVYNPLPKNIDDLKQNITREIKNVNERMLGKTFSNFQKRCSLIISAEGGHIEDK